MRFKTILLVLFFVSIIQAASSKITVDEFLKTTGLIVSEYDLTPGPKECLGGPITVSGTPGKLFVHIGSHIVIEGIGLDQYQYSERECEWDIKTTFQKSKIESSKKIECKNKVPYQSVTKVDIKDDRVVFSFEDIQKEKKNYKCEYKVRR